MKYSQQILDDILIDAKNGLSLSDVSLRLGMPFPELFSDYNNPEYEVKRHYDAGAAQGDTITNSALLGLAENGSVLAKAAYDKKRTLANIKNIFDAIDNE